MLPFLEEKEIPAASEEAQKSNPRRSLPSPPKSLPSKVPEIKSKVFDDCHGLSKPTRALAEVL
jgi:hypothetical protein